MWQNFTKLTMGKSCFIMIVAAVIKFNLLSTFAIHKEKQHKGCPQKEVILRFGQCYLLWWEHPSPHHTGQTIGDTFRILSPSILVDNTCADFDVTEFEETWHSLNWRCCRTGRVYWLSLRPQQLLANMLTILNFGLPATAELKHCIEMPDFVTTFILNVCTHDPLTEIQHSQHQVMVMDDGCYPSHGLGPAFGKTGGLTRLDLWRSCSNELRCYLWVALSA